MGRLKPIGSEKLEGMEKIARIMEIARYKEAAPNPINETTSNEYSVKFADGYLYRICKEKTGYVIKKGLNESTMDYVEPMKNRRHYDSYSGAFKRLNLMAKEINALTETEDGISLFTEQKKYVLKTPKPATPDMGAPVPSPEPEMPTNDAPMPDMDGEEMPTPDMPSNDTPMPDMDSEEMPEPDMEGDDNEEEGFKTIQKLTGKLAQKLRNLEDGEEEVSSKDLKYVINSILSAIDMDKLEDDDKEEIVDRIEGEEEGHEEPKHPMDTDMGDEEVPSPEDMGTEEEPKEMKEYSYIDDNEDDEDFDFNFEFDMEEPKSPHVKKIDGDHSDEHDKFMMDTFESIFNESKVDKIIKGYFSLNESEKKQKTIKETAKNRSIASKIQTIAESKRQEESARKFVKHNPTATLIGKSNKNNLLFECNGKTIKVTTNGQIL
jgi:hypothetical protein